MKRSLCIIMLFCLVILCAGCSPADKGAMNQTTYSTAYIDGEWETDLMENHGIDTVSSENLFNLIVNDKDVLSFLVIKDGYIVSEHYADGYNADSVYHLNASTPSVISAIIGIAIDEDLIKGVDTKIMEYFPEYKEDKINENITIENLLTMTSGWYWPEFTNWSEFGDEWFNSENWVEFVLAGEQRSYPGNAFNYSSGVAHLLSAIIQKSAGVTVSDYANERLFNKIGIKSVEWYDDPQGITLGGFGLLMTSRDAARFGQLYLNKGKWGDQQIISEQWINTSTEKHSDGHFSFSPYGYLWWVDSVNAGKTYDMFYTLAFGGQYIFVVPELNMVAVLNYDDTFDKGTRMPLEYFKRYVNTAMKH